LLEKHSARDPWPAIQNLKAQTAVDIQDRLGGGPVYLSGNVEDIFDEDMRRWVLLRGDSNAASVDFRLYGDRQKLKDIQWLNQQTGADTFSVIAKIHWVRRMNDDGHFLAQGELIDFAMNPAKKTQVHEKGKPDFNL